MYNFEFEKKQAEISYILNLKYSGKGYGTTTVKYIVNLCFSELNIGRIVAFYVDGNRKSEMLLKRCGAVNDKEWNQKVEIKNNIYQMKRCVILNEFE